jgi:hypothetical protein
MKQFVAILVKTHGGAPFRFQSLNLRPKAHALQKKWTGQGVVWLSVISSAPGQPGYVSPQQANKLTADRGAAPTAVLFDPTGEVGHAYSAPPRICT